MGAGNSKTTRQTRHPYLSDVEYSRLKTLFNAWEEQEHLTEKTLRCHWNELLDESLLKLLINYLFKNEKTIDFVTFIQPYVTVVHGSSSEKAHLLCTWWTGSENSAEVPVKAVIDYLQKIISSYMLQVKTLKNKELLSWQVEKFETRDEDVKLFANYLCSGLPQESATVNFEVLEKWICSWSRIALLEKSVFKNLYSIEYDENDGGKEVKFIPRCLMLPRLTTHPSILDITSVIFLNSSLPVDLRDQWRFLFSTAVHGHNFAKLMEHIMNKGPTIIIIEDKEGYVFGGFATHSWKPGPNFAGDDRSFLFSLRPSVNTYFSSDYNDHYQYMNIAQQTFPNGLGMGGQLNYFGFWLDAEFGKGLCSESCTTYKHYKMLSSSKEFTVNHVEVWAVGPEPQKDDDEEEGRKSILDADLQAHALLEMAGKSYHSDGYRDPKEEK